MKVKSVVEMHRVMYYILICYKLGKWVTTILINTHTG